MRIYVLFGQHPCIIILLYFLWSGLTHAALRVSWSVEVLVHEGEGNVSSPENSLLKVKKMKSFKSKFNILSISGKGGVSIFNKFSKFL